MNLPILFLFPRLQSHSYSDLNFIYNLGTAYIIAYLKKEGITAKQFIHKEPIDLNSLADKVLAYKPDIIGFTCSDYTYYLVKLMIKNLKKKIQTY